MDKVRLGFIGTGPRGQGVLKTVVTVEAIELTTICDKWPEQMRRAQVNIPDTPVKCETDYRRVLDDKDIDAVYVCVEPHNNAALVCEALDAGKHVMSDVPLAYTLEECWNIVLATERSGKKFQLGEQTRHQANIRAWRQMAAEGKFGKILCVQGQYLHGMGRDRFFQDKQTGVRLTPEQAKDNPRAIKSRLWNMIHPIFYVPHELSPILSILDDRVVTVAAMGTQRNSYVHEWLTRSDFEMAIMKTEKDTIIRLAAGFNAPTTRPYHWYHIMGTKGQVESNRRDGEKQHMWLADAFMTQPAELQWEFDPITTPAEAMRSGHGGVDYYPFVTFSRAILEDTEPDLHVYRAAETAAPGIVAGMSVEQGKFLTVPDFRPGKDRKAGQAPASMDVE